MRSEYYGGSSGDIDSDNHIRANYEYEIGMCKVAGCKKTDHEAKGMCHYHYQRKYRRSLKCKYSLCEHPVWCNGYCHTHHPTHGYKNHHYRLTPAHDTNYFYDDNV